MNELNTRATRAKQRVVMLEQLLRNHALVALDETCDSDIVTFTPQHDSFNEVNIRLFINPYTSVRNRIYRHILDCVGYRKCIEVQQDLHLELKIL